MLLLQSQVEFSRQICNQFKDILCQKGSLVGRVLLDKLIGTLANRFKSDVRHLLTDVNCNDDADK